MKKAKNNYAYIDGNNLYRGVADSGWKIDFVRFRKWLSNKYGIVKAYYFIGLIPQQKDLYLALQEAGFTLVFKEVLYNGQGEAKGNCDADLVLQAVSDVYEDSCRQLVLVTSDGDYACLVKFLQIRNKLRVILSPNANNLCSILLKRTNASITYLSDVQNKISLNRKSPH